MATDQKTPETVAPQLALAKPAKERTPVKFDADDPVSFYMDSAIFEQLQRVAVMMSRANLVPEHLRGEGRISDCFLVVAQAFRWRMDPFSVAQHTFVTQGKLGYEGKLVAAVVNTSGKLEENLDYVYEGAGPQRKVTVVGRLKGSSKDRTIDGTVAGWATNNDKWKTMTDQMLSYRGAREWARRHMPEAVLGVNAEEELSPASAVELTRTGDGGFAARGTVAPVDPLLVQIGVTAEPVPPAAPEPALVAPCCGGDHGPGDPCETAAPGCAHPGITTQRLAELKPKHSLVCVDCGENIQGLAPEDAVALRLTSPARRSK